MNTHSFTISEAIKTGWQFTKKYFWTLMLLMALAYLPSLISELLNFGIAHIPGASEMISDPVSGIPTNQPVGIWVFITAAISIIGGIV